MAGPNSGAMGGNPMMNGMLGQMGFGFPNQAGFGSGMSWNGMNQMNGMPNMMAGGGWNGMNQMGTSLHHAAKSLGFSGLIEFQISTT